MRITNQLQHNMLVGHIKKNQTDVYRLQEQVASGNRMRVASDDPTSWAAVARLRRQEGELALHEENSLQMESRLSSIDLSLSSMGDILQNASEIAVQAGQSTLNREDRTIMAEEIDQLLEALVMQSNMKVDGQHVFGGTQSSMESFAATRNGDGRINSVAYTGSEEVSTIDVGAGDAMGRQMVGGGQNGVLISTDANAFTALINMRDRLLNGENLAETDAQGLVNDALGQVLMGRAVTGAQMERLDIISSFREMQRVQVTGQAAAEEGVDIAEAVAELSAKNVAYEAALAMSAKIMNISLLKFI